MSSSTGTPRGLHNEVVDAGTGTTTTWDALPTVRYPDPAVVLVDSSFEALPFVVAHSRTDGELLIVAGSRMEPALSAELIEAGFTIVHGGDRLEPPAQARRGGEPDRLWLLTSGSTGRPKRIGHTLETLTTVTTDQAPRRWLCPYSPGTYAWWQLVTLGLALPGQDLVVVDPADVEHWVEAGVTHEVSAASGTPTFWRQTIMQSGDRLRDVPLAQVTLGGEPVDQSIIDQLVELFPTARVSWIYASSELGASIVVHDGEAGFPIAWLDNPAPDRPSLSVDGDELVIASPHHGKGLGGPVRTGDRVVVEDGRVLITGRLDSDEINVGGAKVSAGQVRDVLQSHPDVAWASVRGRKAPMVGSMVVAQVVAATGADDAASLPVRLTQWCRERLPEYGVPRMIRVRDEIPTKETLKSDV